MANTLGALVVSLGLDAAEFTAGLTKSEYQAKKFADALDRGVATAIRGTALAVTALVTATGVAVSVFDSLAKGAAQFKDLEESTGASAESLASLAVSGAAAGVTMDSIGAAANKLTKTLVGVNDESKAAGAALGAIGISVKDFKNLDPVAQYEAVGKALGNFADGAGKVAIAQALFGKNGAEQLRVFKALEEAGGRQTILTQQQIELADAYADAQAKAAAQLKLYAQAAATEAIPALNDLTQVAVEVAKQFLGVDAATGQLAANNGVKAFAEAGVDALAFLIDSVDGVVRVFQVAGKTIAGVSAGYAAVVKGNFEQARAIGQALEADIDRVLARATFAQRIADTRAARTANDSARSQEDRGFVPTASAKPALKFNFDTAAAGNAAAEQRKLLDGQLRAIRDFAQDQRDAFEFANTLVKGQYDDGLSTLRQFYESQAAIRDAGLQAQLTAIDKEVAALRSYKPRDAADRVDNENKIADAVRRRSETIVRSTRDNVLSALEEQRATASLARSYVDLIAQVRDLSGDRRGAASLRIARQVADAQKLITQQGGDSGLADSLERQLSGAADLADAQEHYNDLLVRARNEEEALLLAAREAGQSENDMLRAVGAARADSLRQLSEMVDRANELALALGTPDAIRFAEGLAAALRRATAEVDPLLLKIRDVGREAGDAIAGGFEDAILQGKGLSETLKAIDKDLARILVRNLVTKPLGDYLTNAIGGNGQASGGGGWIGAAGNFIASYFGGGKAIGGPTMPNSVYPISERQPEVYSDGSRSWLITGSQRGRVDPNPSMGGGGRTLNMPITINVPGNTDRRTAGQIGAEAARQVAAANSRFN